MWTRAEDGEEDLCIELTFFELIRGVLTVEAAVNRIEIITRIV